MCGGMLQGIFVFLPVDSNQGNVSQLVQMSSLINRTAEVECHLLQRLSVVEYGSALLYALRFISYVHQYHSMISTSYNLCD